MKRTVELLLVVGALLACHSDPVKAQVQCQEHTGGFACKINTQGGSGHDYNVCWDIVVNCADGQKLTANTCQDVSGEGQSSSIVPNEKFTGGLCKVGAVTGISVSNVKVVRK